MNQRTRHRGRDSWYPRPGALVLAACALVLAACALLTACHSTIPAGRGHIEAPGPMTGQAATKQTELPVRMIAAGPVYAQDLGRAGGSTISGGRRDACTAHGRR